MEQYSNNPVSNDSIELIIKSSNYTSLYLFLSSNGTMTYNLNYLFPQLQIKLVLSKTEELSHIKNINSKYSSLFGKEIDLFFINKQPLETLVYREIDFYTKNKEDSEKTILKGVSYWDSDIYKEIMGEEENSAIGLVMMKNKIEFFKTMVFLENDCEGEFDSNYDFIRMIKFYIKGKEACLLFEVIKINNVIDKFGFFINTNNSTDDDLINNEKDNRDGYYNKKDFFDIIISSIQKKYKSICS